MGLYGLLPVQTSDARAVRMPKSTVNDKRSTRNLIIEQNSQLEVIDRGCKFKPHRNAGTFLADLPGSSHAAGSLKKSCRSSGSSMLSLYFNPHSPSVFDQSLTK